MPPKVPSLLHAVSIFVFVIWRLLSLTRDSSPLVSSCDSTRTGTPPTPPPLVPGSQGPRVPVRITATWKGGEGRREARVSTANWRGRRCGYVAGGTCRSQALGSQALSLSRAFSVAPVAQADRPRAERMEPFPVGNSKMRKARDS